MQRGFTVRIQSEISIRRRVNLAIMDVQTRLKKSGCIARTLRKHRYKAKVDVFTRGKLFRRCREPPHAPRYRALARWPRTGLEVGLHSLPTIAAQHQPMPEMCFGAKQLHNGSFTSRRHSRRDFDSVYANTSGIAPVLPRRRLALCERIGVNRQSTWTCPAMNNKATQSSLT